MGICTTLVSQRGNKAIATTIRAYNLNRLNIMRQLKRVKLCNFSLAIEYVTTILPINQCYNTRGSVKNQWFKISIFGQMKWFCAIIFWAFMGCYSTAYAQGNDLQLAQQYTTNGEPLKAL